MNAKTLTMEARARSFAAFAHGSINQTRKYTGEPYITHPAAVVAIVRSVSHTEEMIAAAWLHDTVEDTNTTIGDIERQFGREVAKLVSMLTDVSVASDGKRAVRKQLDLQHTAQACPQAKTIKLADLLDNTRSIVAHDPDFARVYLKEKVALLEVLRDGNEKLWGRASMQLQLHQHLLLS